jgi:hypothetical protein
VRHDGRFVFAPGFGEDIINDLNRGNAVSLAAQAASERDLRAYIAQDAMSEAARRQ